MAGSNVVFTGAPMPDVRFGLEHPRRDGSRAKKLRLPRSNSGSERSNESRRSRFILPARLWARRRCFQLGGCAVPIQTLFMRVEGWQDATMIQAYCEGFGVRVISFRFVSNSRGALHQDTGDFSRQLIAAPTRLRVLRG